MLLKVHFLFLQANRYGVCIMTHKHHSVQHSIQRIDTPGLAQNFCNKNTKVYTLWKSYMNASTPSKTDQANTPVQAKTPTETDQTNTPSETGQTNTPTETGQTNTPTETNQVNTPTETGQANTPTETSQANTSVQTRNPSHTSRKRCRAECEGCRKPKCSSCTNYLNPRWKKACLGRQCLQGNRQHYMYMYSTGHFKQTTKFSTVYSCIYMYIWVNCFTLLSSS